MRYGNREDIKPGRYSTLTSKEVGRQGGPVCCCNPESDEFGLEVPGQDSGGHLYMRTSLTSEQQQKVAGEAIWGNVFRQPEENSTGGTQNRDPARKEHMGGLATNFPEAPGDHMQRNQPDAGRQAGEGVQKFLVKPYNHGP